MPNAQSRIEALKARIAEKQEKLSKLKTVQRLNQGIQEHQAKLEELTKVAAKESANQRRKRDNRSKIVVTSGLTLLPRFVQVLIVHEILPKLDERDRTLVITWYKDRGIDLDGSKDQVSLVAAASLARVVAGMAPGNFDMVTTEILGAAAGTDREVLEAWIAAFGAAKKPHDNAAVSASVQPDESGSK